MSTCKHLWEETEWGDERGRAVVRCLRCGKEAKIEVATNTPPPTHLEPAREDHKEAMLVPRGSSGYFARLEGAIGHLICYLEAKQDKGKGATDGE